MEVLFSAIYAELRLVSTIRAGDRAISLDWWIAEGGKILASSSLRHGW